MEFSIWPKYFQSSSRITSICALARYYCTHLNAHAACCSIFQHSIPICPQNDVIKQLFKATRNVPSNSVLLRPLSILSPRSFASAASIIDLPSFVKISLPLSFVKCVRGGHQAFRRHSLFAIRIPNAHFISKFSIWQNYKWFAPKTKMTLPFHHRNEAAQSLQVRLEHFEIAQK